MLQRFLPNAETGSDMPRSGPIGTGGGTHAGMISDVEAVEWLALGEIGIGHRDAALRSGVTEKSIRTDVRAGAVRLIRRSWLALPTASGDLVDAAGAGARVACTSAARHRGWWLPETVDEGLHLHFRPHARSARFAGVAHWSAHLAPTSHTSLVESPEDALAHVAGCLDPESARIVWESAITTEKLSVEALRNVRWTTLAARDLAQQVTGLSDSGLESIFVVRLSPWGMPIRQQIKLGGRFVDLLIGERLVIQVDGFAYHSTAAQRGRDVAHDTELRLRGYTVLRFTYAQVVHDWPTVERAIARAIAAGAHRAA